MGLRADARLVDGMTNVDHSLSRMIDILGFEIRAHIHPQPMAHPTLHGPSKRRLFEKGGDVC